MTPSERAESGADSHFDEMGLDMGLGDNVDLDVFQTIRQSLTTSLIGRMCCLSDIATSPSTSSSSSSSSPSSSSSSAMIDHHLRMVMIDHHLRMVIDQHRKNSDHDQVTCSPFDSHSELPKINGKINTDKVFSNSKAHFFMMSMNYSPNFRSDRVSILVKKDITNKIPHLLIWPPYDCDLTRFLAMIDPPLIIPIIKRRIKAFKYEILAKKISDYIERAMREVITPTAQAQRGVSLRPSNGIELAQYLIMYGSVAMYTSNMRCLYLYLMLCPLSSVTA